MYSEFNDMLDFIHGIFNSKSEGIFTSKEFMSAIVGAVVGTVGSGGVTYLMQRSANKQTAALRDDDRHAVQGALARALLYKLVRIASGSFAIYKHLKPCMDAAGEKGSVSKPWQGVLKLANIPSPVSITIEEMGIIYDIGDNEISSSLIMADEAYLRLLTTAGSINELKEEISQIATILPGKAGEFSLEIPKEKRGEFDKTVHELDGILMSTFEDAENISNTMSSIIAKIQPILKDKYGIKYVYQVVADIGKIK